MSRGVTRANYVDYFNVDLSRSVLGKHEIFLAKWIINKEEIRFRNATISPTRVTWQSISYHSFSKIRFILQVKMEVSLFTTKSFEAGHWSKRITTKIFSLDITGSDSQYASTLRRSTIQELLKIREDGYLKRLQSGVTRMSMTPLISFWTNPNVNDQIKLFHFFCNLIG